MMDIHVEGDEFAEDSKKKIIFKAFINIFLTFYYSRRSKNKRKSN